MFDLIDGGVPAIFNDGPKEGHVGVVSNQRGDGPPRGLTFYSGRLVYVRRGPRKFKVLNHETGKPRKVKGVAYAVDPKCPFMLEVARENEAAAALRDAQRIETT